MIEVDLTWWCADAGGWAHSSVGLAVDWFESNELDGWY
jgi:hypothetical protein